MDPPIKSIITIDAPPKLDDFTPLAEFQEATPVSFFDGKPVLHFHAAGARALVPASHRKRLPVFRGAEPAAAAAATAEGAVEEEQLVEQKVDVFVNSANFTLFSQDATCGVKIPYPLIGIHAVKTLPNASPSDAPVQAVYMQLDLQDGGADDETYDTVELTIIPPLPAAATTTTDDVTPPATAAPSRNAPKSEAAALFAAISACAELHPDPADADDDDEDGAHGYEIDDRIVFEAADGFAPASGVFRGAADGGLPPPMPGSSGWITADNVADYFDADGNWIGGPGVSGELGEGAGRVRGRDEAEGDDGGAADNTAAAGGASGANGQGANGHAGEDDPENKRQRTE